MRTGEILDGDAIIEATLNAADAAVVHAALVAAHKLGVNEPSGDDETLEDGTTTSKEPEEPEAPKDIRTPAQQRADALVLIAHFFWTTTTPSPKAPAHQSTGRT